MLDLKEIEKDILKELIEGNTLQAISFNRGYGEAWASLRLTFARRRNDLTSNHQLIAHAVDQGLINVNDNHRN